MLIFGDVEHACISRVLFQLAADLAQCLKSTLAVLRLDRFLAVMVVD